MPPSAHPIVRLLSTDPKRVVGLMPGSSLARIDAALCEIAGHGPDARVRLLGFRACPLPPRVLADVEALLDPRRPAAAAEVGALGFRLGHAFAEAAAAVAGDDPPDLVGSHGLTVWHQPPWMKERADLVASTLQLGEPAVIAARTGAVTVGDFRVADMAVSGAGAPIVPYADWVLFRPAPGARRVRALLNVGAITNVTVVSEQLADVFAFDTGPGCLLLDALAARAADPAVAPAIPDPLESPDPEGALAARGRVLPAVLAELLDDDFLRRPPPRSTGRERYGRAFAERLAERNPRARAVDLLATAVAFTAESIASGYRAFIAPRAGLALDEILVSGAGARNRTLLAHLRDALAPVPVRPFEELGMPAEAKEAVAFALLAVECVHAMPANVRSATGALRPAVLGKICLPPG